ncbi:MAG: four helix bundle protein [Blastochloris sp.]|nr:four helix bundle protein [Blastochloris sp.]
MRLQRELVAAARRREKRQALQAADEALHELRLLLRQGRDLNLLTAGQHEHVSRMVDEIGRLLGGWRKAQAQAARNGPNEISDEEP